MSKYYVKSKRYVIRPSKRTDVINFIEANLKGSKYQQALRRVTENNPMYYRRWLYYFDINYLDDILMEDGCVEIPLEEQKKLDNLTGEDLGI